MKNNTKLIMETWRRFLNEDSLDPDLDSGFSSGDDSRPSGQDSRPSGQSDSEDDSEADYFDDVSQGVDDRDSLNGIDEPIDGEPPFDSEDPVTPEDDFVDLPHAGDDIEYSREDAQMSAKEKEDAFDERFYDLYDDDI